MDKKYGRLFTQDDVINILRNCGVLTAAIGAPRIIELYEGKFPVDEPLFLLLGRDEIAPDAIHDYAVSAELKGASAELVLSVRRQQREFEDWQREHPERVKLPD